MSEFYRRYPDIAALEDVDESIDREDPFPEIDTSPVFYVAGRAVFHARRTCPTLDGSRRRTAGGTAFLPRREVDWGPCPMCFDVVGGEDS